MKGHIDNSTIGLESKELDLSSCFKERNTSTINLYQNLISIKYISYIDKLNDFPIYKYNETARRLLSKSYREHCEKIEACHYKHLYSSIKLRDLEKMVNKIMNKTNE